MAKGKTNNGGKGNGTSKAAAKAAKAGTAGSSGTGARTDAPPVAGFDPIDPLAIDPPHEDIGGTQIGEETDGTATPPDAEAPETEAPAEPPAEPPPAPSKREQFAIELAKVEAKLREIGDPLAQSRQMQAALAEIRKERAAAIEAWDTKVNRLYQEAKDHHNNVAVPNEGLQQRLKNRKHELEGLIAKIDEEVTLG